MQMLCVVAVDLHCFSTRKYFFKVYVFGIILMFTIVEQYLHQQLRQGPQSQTFEGALTLRAQHTQNITTLFVVLFVSLYHFASFRHCFASLCSLIFSWLILHVFVGFGRPI